MPLASHVLRINYATCSLPMVSLVLIRHSPDELWNGVDGSRRQSSPEATGGLRSAPGVSVILGVPNDVCIRRFGYFPRHSDTLLPW